MKPTESKRELSPDERKRIERFLNVFNQIVGELRLIERLPREPLRAVVEAWVRGAGARTADAAIIAMASRLRNVLVHDRTEPFQYLAVPTAPVVDRLITVLKHIRSPKVSGTSFRRPVETVQTTDNLASVLKQIARRDFSQFPVYNSGTFCGLLTENGITRWLARHSTSVMSLVDLEEVLVKEVLPEEERRERNWAFVSKGKLADEVVQMFADQELLEAILVTSSGRATEALLGIATRWDILRLRAT